MPTPPTAALDQPATRAETEAPAAATPQAAVPVPAQPQPPVAAAAATAGPQEPAPRPEAEEPHGTAPDDRMTLDDLVGGPDHESAILLRDLLVTATNLDATRSTTVYLIRPHEYPAVVRSLTNHYTPQDATPRLHDALGQAARGWFMRVQGALGEHHGERLQELRRQLDGRVPEDLQGVWGVALEEAEAALGHAPPSALIDHLLDNHLRAFLAEARADPTAWYPGRWTTGADQDRQTPEAEGGTEEGGAEPLGDEDRGDDGVPAHIEEEMDTEGASFPTTADGEEIPLSPPRTPDPTVELDPPRHGAASEPPHDNTTTTAAPPTLAGGPTNAGPTRTPLGPDHLTAPSTVSAAAAAAAAAAATNTPLGRGLLPTPAVARIGPLRGQNLMPALRAFARVLAPDPGALARAATAPQPPAGHASSSPSPGPDASAVHGRAPPRSTPSPAALIFHQVRAAGDATSPATAVTTPPPAASAPATPARGAQGPALLPRPTAPGSAPALQPGPCRPPPQLFADDGEDDDADLALIADDPVAFVPGSQSASYTSHRVDKNAKEGRSKKDWRIQPLRQVLLIGDSNLERIPPVADNRVQVDSYPGATLHHAAAILEGLEGPYPGVRRVVLSFGINDRLHCTPDTFRRNLRQLLEVAGRRFTRALVFVAVIPYAAELPERDRERLRAFNAVIRGQPWHLKSPEPEQIQAGPDHVHWTAVSAFYIWSTWRAQLNLSPPAP